MVESYLTGTDLLAASVLYLVDLDSISPSSQTKRLKKLVFTAFLLNVLLWRDNADWRTSRQVRSLCPWARHLTGFNLHLMVWQVIADGSLTRWPKRSRYLDK